MTKINHSNQVNISEWYIILNKGNGIEWKNKDKQHEFLQKEEKVVGDLQRNSHSVTPNFKVSNTTISLWK